MQDITTLLSPEERVTLALRGLYETYGYRKFRMNRFEAYDFYAVYRDFLPSGQMITFTDLNGRLMAMRPDVTLSIAKKAYEQTGGSQRLYYAEPVYRPDREENGYREAHQVGLEYLGDLTGYATAEVTTLAVRSLALIGPRTMLDISHTGFLCGLLDTLPLEADTRLLILRCFAEKNAHELMRVAEGKLTADATERLMAVTRLSGSFPEALPKARALATGDVMQGAVDTLQAVYDALVACGETNNVRLDFSISSDTKYYSGLMLRGYVEGVPGAVLSGGRYDPLLRRMGKKALSGMGFAIYFDVLAQYLSQTADEAVDTVVLYPAQADPADVERCVQARVAQGERVWAGTAVPEGLGYSQVVRVDADA